MRDEDYRMKIKIDLYKLAKILCEKEQFTRRELEQYLAVDSRTAGKIIVKMLNKGLLIKKNEAKKNTKYSPIPFLCIKNK